MHTIKDNFFKENAVLILTKIIHFYFHSLKMTSHFESLFFQLREEETRSGIWSRTLTYNDSTFSNEQIRSTINIVTYSLQIIVNNHLIAYNLLANGLGPGMDIFSLGKRLSTKSCFHWYIS